MNNPTYPLLVLFLISVLSYQGLAQSSDTLYAGAVFEASLSSAQENSYVLEMKNGMGLKGQLLQVDDDLKIEVYSPDGDLYKVINRQRRTGRYESIDVTANSDGAFTFLIKAAREENSTGEYRLEVEAIFDYEENIQRITKKEIRSRTMFDLWKASLRDEQAIDSFMQSHSQRHIIEALEGNEKKMLVTYFCVPVKNTDYVMLSGGPDFLGLRFQRLPSTDLFFVSQEVPVDARFNYGFNYFLLEKAGPAAGIEERRVEHADRKSVV